MAHGFSRGGRESGNPFESPTSEEVDHPARKGTTQGCVSVRFRLHQGTTRRPPEVPRTRHPVPYAQNLFVAGRA